MPYESVQAFLDLFKILMDSIKTFAGIIWINYENLTLLHSFNKYRSLKININFVEYS